MSVFHGLSAGKIVHAPAGAVVVVVGGRVVVVVGVLVVVEGCAVVVVVPPGLVVVVEGGRCLASAGLLATAMPSTTVSGTVTARSSDLRMEGVSAAAARKLQSAGAGSSISSPG